MLEEQKLDIDEIKVGMEHHCRRIMFGSDHPAGMGSVQQILDDFHGFGLADDANEYILYRTAASFLQAHCGTYYIEEGNQEPKIR
jgi:hypothetical protein